LRDVKLIAFLIFFPLDSFTNLFFYLMKVLQRLIENPIYIFIRIHLVHFYKLNLTLRDNILGPAFIDFKEYI
jgi:hypothetical protein